ncbi:uncharacterized protein LOC125762176 [Anopheles funestus]|uniref:uncharacterized protein LOC125762176 n=1 Tax=Anopheles funestus TaxID=62324 RepID=UPI0020C6A8C1|nr:uncharacterized protein LOC125762176 [Anopheles funestus]
MFRHHRSNILRAVLCCWLFLTIGHAEPVPEFAINAVVSGSATVSTLALETKALFVNAGGTTFQLNAGYNRLATVKAAMTTIATRLSTAGATLTQAISNMALNNSGPIATYFDSISSAIQSLQTIITSGLTAELNTLTGTIGNYVTAKFGDSFHTMSQTLTTLSQAVASLRTAVTNARNAAGSSPTVSATLVRRYLTTRIVTDITNAVRLLKSDVPILVYIVRTTLGSIQTADEYLSSIADEAHLRANDVNELGNNFSSDVNDFVVTVKTNTTQLTTARNTLIETYESTLQSDVQSDDNFGAMVGGLLTKIDSIYNDDVTVGSTIDGKFATYLQRVQALDDDLATFYGTSMCAVVQNLLQVLIENGPNAQFCFSKYGQKVFNFFVLHTYDSADCYRLQLIRLDKLLTATYNIVLLLLHDIDDFLENVERCTHFNNLENCVTFLGTEYQTLFTYTTEKRDYLYRLLTKETNASYYRLAGCFDNSKHLLMLDAEQMMSNIDHCELHGPN